MIEPGLLLVYGAGGHGKVVADAARSAGWVVTGFIDDAPGREDATIWGLPVRTLDRMLAEVPAAAGAAFAMGIGDNAARARCQAGLAAKGCTVVTIVHARAAVAPSAVLGAGTVVMANAAVNPDARLGAGCIVNTGAVVEHDCVLGDHVHLSPNAALGGAVRVGDRSHLGIGAVVLPAVQVGRGVRVGAGAAVIRDVADDLTVVGVPARPIRQGEGGK